MSAEISEPLSTTLSGLYTELQNFLNETESTLHIAKCNFEQAQDILKPWKIPQIETAKSQCSCQNLSSTQSENNEDAALLNNIKKTLSTAVSVRQKKSKTNTKLVKTSKTSSENTLKNKTSSSLVQKTSSIPLHNPSCPLYKTSTEFLSKTSFTLTESLSYYKIPNKLVQTINSSTDIMCSNTKQNFENKYKKLFLQELDKQNEKCWAVHKRDASLELFLTYLNAFHSYQNKLKDVNDGWIFYNNKQNLKDLQSSKHNLHLEKSWSVIVKHILNNFVPDLEKCDLSYKQKLSLYKILKTVCNFANSDPSVPIFKIRPHGTENKD